MNTIRFPKLLFVLFFFQAFFSHAQGNSGFRYGNANTLLAFGTDKLFVFGMFLSINGRILNTADSPTGIHLVNASGSLDDGFKIQDCLQVWDADHFDEGSIVVAANRGQKRTAYRIFHDGRFDAEFAANSERVFQGGGIVRSVLSLPNGKTLVGGEFDISPGVRFGRIKNLVLLNRDGSLDDSIPFWNRGNVGPVHDLQLLSDGRILVTGNSAITPGRPNGPVFFGVDIIENDLRPTRQLRSLGEGFSEGSRVVTAGIALNGSFLLGGAWMGFDGFNQDSLGIISLKPDGSRDLSFNRDGRGFTEEGSDRTGSVNVIKVLKDGKILVGGMFGAYNRESNISKGLVRLNADGSLDRAFNPGGTGFGNSGQVKTLLVDNEGRIYVGGVFLHFNGQRVPDGLIRLLPDGTYDPSFFSL